MSFINHNNIYLKLLNTVFSVGLFVGCVGYSTLSFAQADNAFENTLDDLTMDIDALPPQPSQTVMPENEGDISVAKQPTSPKAVVEVQNIPVAPTTPLDPITPEPLVAAEANQSVDTGPAVVPHSGLYYDSDSFAPDSSLGSVGPREVDPRYEPASRFVVVNRSAGPGSLQARIVSAQRALSLGRYSAALEMYEQLYKKTPKNKQVLMGLAVAQQNSGFTESAMSTYEELLKIDPKNTNATSNMLGLVTAKYPSVAYRKLKDLWEKNSQNPGLAAQLGLTSASLGDADEAIRYLGIAASMEPNNPSHYYNMAVVSDQAGAYKDAIDLYQKALEIDVSYGNARTLPRDQIYDRLANLRRL